LAQHGRVGLRQASCGRDAGLAGVTNSVDRTLKGGADTAAQWHRFVKDTPSTVASYARPKRISST
jgi:hypothetical protein